MQGSNLDNVAPVIQPRKRQLVDLSKMYWEARERQERAARGY
jgi:hypothetical protein